MKKEINYCRHCKNFICYYRKVLGGYCYMGYGHCTVKNCLQDEFRVCENFAEKPQTEISEKHIECAICETDLIKELLIFLKNE